MSHRLRRALSVAPIKLIAVVLFAVLVPSVLITALGLLEVFQADRYVRESFSRPIRRKLDGLAEALQRRWSERLASYRESVTSNDDLIALARLPLRAPEVRQVFVVRPSSSERLDPRHPELLPAVVRPAELNTLVSLEGHRGDDAGALAEARRLLSRELDDRLRVDVLLAAARLSHRLGDPEGALDYLQAAYDDYGNTLDGFGVVRGVPILLRRAEIESALSRVGDFLVTLREVATLLERVGPLMDAGVSAALRTRLDELVPGDHNDAVVPTVDELEDPRLLSADVWERIVARLPRPASFTDINTWRFFSFSDPEGGQLDFAGAVDSERQRAVYLLFDVPAWLADVEHLASEFDVAPRSVELRVPGVPTSDSETAFAVPAAAPFIGRQLTYRPSSDELPAGFRGFNVVSLAAFTWAVIVLVLTIVVGIAITLRSLLRELETARLKSDFVSFVTHELKTPLTAVRMYTETLLEGRVRDEADGRECVRMIDQETLRLSNLIDQILEYSKVERRQKKFQFVSCDMIDVVREAVEIFHSHFQDQPREVEVNAAQHISKIRMDRAAMVELLLNLLTNAAKYSAPDTVIAVNVTESVGDISVQVVDHGVGIRKRDQKRIFERFYRAEDYLSRDVDGTGLGLAFARYIAKVHNGDIRVSSQFGGGSTFTLVLRKTHVLAE